MRRFLYLFIVAALLMAGLAGQHFRFFERAWFNWTVWQKPFEHAIGLDDYRVVIEARPVEGVADDLSALTYNPDRRTLFTLTNAQSELIELSLEGRILRRVPLVGFGDPEAIEYIGPNLYVIADERGQRLIKIHLSDDTQVVDAQNAEQLILQFGPGGNKGFEGLGYDVAGKRLFIAKERDPMLIYEVQGFPHGPTDPSYSVHVVQNSQRDKGLFVRDLSSLQFDARTGHLLALSEESRLLLELDVDGRPISSLSLSKGKQGLSRTVPQAEGIAMDGEGTIYLVSEPNLFYVFKKPL